MSSTKIPAVVDTQYAILKGLFDKGDKVNIEIIRYKEDTIIHEDIYAIRNTEKSVNYKKGEYVIIQATKENPERGIFKLYDKVIAEKGSMKSWHVKSKNGHYYDESCFHSFIGYKSLGEIFKRLN